MKALLTPVFINQILQEQFRLKRPLERTTIQKQQQNFFATVTSSLGHHLHQEEVCLASLDDVVAFLKKKSLQFPQLQHLSN